MSARRIHYCIICMLVGLATLLITGCQAVPASPIAAATSAQTTAGVSEASPLPTSAVTAGPAKTHLLILHTNDALGYLDPCG